MTKEVIYRAKAEVIRPDENGIPKSVKVPLIPVTEVGGLIVSTTKRRELGSVDQGIEPGTTIPRTTSSRWGLPEDPPGGARLLG